MPPTLTATLVQRRNTSWINLTFPITLYFQTLYHVLHSLWEGGSFTKLSIVTFVVGGHL